MKKYNYTPRKPKIEALVYSVPEVASLLDINLPRAYELARQPGFPAICVGKRVIVPKAAFEQWLERAVLDKQSYGAAESQ
ncbi:MAG: helix-turn-helix domain-containing protein [Dethiobacter sp.]|nr:helix-turn-helix domain-containing protein [Dethiobacter sp.]